MGLGIYEGLMRFFIFYLGGWGAVVVKDVGERLKTEMQPRRRKTEILKAHNSTWEGFLKILGILSFIRMHSSLCRALFGLWCAYIFPCVHTWWNRRFIPGSFFLPLFPYIQISPSSRREDTKGLNLLCDTGFPLGSHKQRTQRPWISLF